ncbi:KptA family-domain-containing protein [Cercophora newfieldiana]|uniref:2'-phosphotransferase n=1 Tax=Cercophora newfieldiana TaxID=92897 RepID=A0AA39Y604_9PEZI|nr:KptA family-domain-containing protein [Cercophora newfieldiana]
MASDQIATLAEEFEDRASVSTSTRGGGGSRGGRFRGGRSGGGSKGREVDLSRALSRLLRHQAANAGIDLDAEGYAPLDKVLAWGPLRTLAPTFEEIASLVRTNDKQRFTLKPASDGDETSTLASDWLIRANQGHSIKLDNDGLLKPLGLPDESGVLPEGSVAVPETVIHGTYFAFWPGIVSSGGLRPMGRNHVHCSVGLPEEEGDVVSGMRKDAEVLVYVDVEGSMREGGMKWWMRGGGGDEVV